MSTPDEALDHRLTKLVADLADSFGVVLPKQSTETQEPPLFDAWRISSVRAGELWSPARGVTTGHRMALTTAVHVADCRLRSDLVPTALRLGIPLPHKAPHPRCVCGIYACTSLGSLAGYARVARWAGGVAIYRVALDNPLPSVDRSDPPDTWRAERATIVGPIFLWGTDDLHPRYGAATVLASTDVAFEEDYRRDPLAPADDTFARLAVLEPPPNAEPCRTCSYRHGHAADCATAGPPWWSPWNARAASM